MKILSLIPTLWVSLSLIHLPNFQVWAARLNDSNIEIAIRGVYLPPLGYDDNDNISVVLDGLLPNACYRLAGSQFTRQQTYQLKVTQFATRRTDGMCAPGLVLPPAESAPIPFSVELYLGRLNIGQYEIVFKSTNVKMTRHFRVEQAPSIEVDNMPYAPVTNVFLPDQITERENVVALLTGSLTSTCMSLNESFQTRKVDDVFIILPGVKLIENAFCLLVLVPFERQVSIGPVTQGRYLLHTRSLNGNAVNRMFSVVPR